MSSWIGWDTLIVEVITGCDKVFVYGTLRRGLPLHHHLDAGVTELVSEGTIHGRLYDLGEYPGALASGKPEDRVKGEVYLLQDVERQLQELDLVEECRPDRPHDGLFLRRVANVRMTTGGILEAWAYFLPKKPDKARLIPGGDYARKQPSPDR